MTKHYEILKEAFKKKIAFVFILAIICAGGLMVEKYYNSDFMVESGAFVVTAITKIDDPSVKEHPYVEFDYRALAHTNGNFDDFITANATSGKYQFNKVYGNWKALKGEKKYTWLRQHFQIKDCHNGAMEFSFRVNENEAKDTEYLKENGTDILDEFIYQTEKTLQLVRPNAKIEIMHRSMVTPEYIKLSKTSVIIKYGIIGFILGACLAMLIIFIMTLGRKR